RARVQLGLAAAKQIAVAIDQRREHAPFEPHTDASIRAQVDAAAERGRRERLGVEAGQGGVEARDAGRETDEGPRALTIEDVQAAEVQIVDVDVELGPRGEARLRVERRRLSTVEGFPVAVRRRGGYVEHET